jgi:kynurenine formamidase
MPQLTRASQAMEAIPVAAKYIDVTGPLTPAMWSYRPLTPDNPLFEIHRFATVSERGWEADAFSMSTLTGTYLETSKHLWPDHRPIADVPLDRFFVNATIARIPKGSREHITVADLESSVGELNPGDALLVATGWDKYWFDDGAIFVMESPHFDLDAMKWISAKGVSILGGDMPCFDDPQPGGGQDVNRVLFGGDALILAPLVGLDQVSKSRVRLNVFPLKLADACGSPCRAIIIED